MEKKTNLIKFEVRDTKDVVFKQIELQVPQQITYSEAVKLFTEFFTEHADEPVANIKATVEHIIREWQATKKFPDGAFMWMKADCHPHFRVGYLYKVESL